MSLPDTIFIFGLALVIFGPKKLPEIGRQIGKLVLEFRRASNEFKLQIEEELRSAEEQDRQRGITAAAAAPAAETPLSATSEPPTIRPPSSGTTVSADQPTRAAVADKEEDASPEAASPHEASVSVDERSPVEAYISELDAPSPAFAASTPPVHDLQEDPEQTIHHHG